jgi:glutamate racemase
MNNTGQVAFFDSGIGGLPYLNWVRNAFPGISCSYLADRENFPYGQKSINELVSLIIATMERYIKAVNPSLVVVACNTASVTSLQALRDHFDVPFVGVVPAIKPAAALSRRRSIGLLATRRTVEDPYTDNLVRLFADGYLVERFAGVDIVNFVENRLLDAEPDEVERVVEPAVRFFREKNIDTLVLGCTHFLHIRETLVKAFGPEIEIVDSLEGVGKQVIRLIDRDGASSSADGPAEPDCTAVPGSLFFKTGSRENDRMYRRFAGQYGLEWGGLL